MRLHGAWITMQVLFREIPKGDVLQGQANHQNGLQRTLATTTIATKKYLSFFFFPRTELCCEKGSTSRHLETLVIILTFITSFLYELKREEKLVIQHFSVESRLQEAISCGGLTVLNPSEAHPLRDDIRRRFSSIAAIRASASRPQGTNAVSSSHREIKPRPPCPKMFNMPASVHGSAGPCFPIPSRCLLIPLSSR